MDSNLKQRIITGVILAVLFLALLLYSAGTAQALFIIIMLAMLYEFCAIALAGVTSAFTYVFVSILGSIALIILVVYRWSDPSYLLIINYISCVYLLLSGLYLLLKKRTALHQFPTLHSFIYITFPILVLLFWIKETPDYGHVLFAIFAMIWISDIAAYFVGKNFGKHKLFESVSPKKTWEGFFGGGVFTIITAIICSNLIPSIGMVHWIGIGLIVWLFGSLGDLVESAMKRHFKIKDSGTILAGHGGFLDRLDSFIFAIPFVMLYINQIIYAS